MSCTALDHGQNGGQGTPYRTDLLPVRICCGGHCKKMAEQFIRSVDQVHIHVVSDQILGERCYKIGQAIWEIIPMLWTITRLGRPPQRSGDSIRYTLKYAERI